MASFPEEKTTQSNLMGCVSSEVQGHLSDSLLFFLGIIIPSVCFWCQTLLHII